MSAKKHWENVYTTKPTTGVSWYQEHAERSLQTIIATRAAKVAEIIDVGGGASTLVDDLLGEGYENISVLDLSAHALMSAKARLGERAAQVRWIEADITQADLPENHFDVWHDRAVFHFLVAEQDRAAYLRNVMRSVKIGGHVIVATFADDGPTQCSGLPVMRYKPESLHGEFGVDFELVSHSREAHNTPFGTIQQFVYCYCVKKR
jgi:ubiquinone/menaquinone biosynthesis C-methylase UbiE